MGPPVSSTNKTDCHDITEILLKVPLNTTKQTNFKNCVLTAYIFFVLVLINHLNFLMAKSQR